MRTPSFFFVMTLVCTFSAGLFDQHAAVGSEFSSDMKPLLTKYCEECHSGEDANGDVNFQLFNNSDVDIAAAFELWESVAGHLEGRTMPPDDSPQPSEDERQSALNWYQSFVDSVEARPAVHRPRRLSVIEYRNTLSSLLGFDLEVDVIEAEQTDTERSLVVKLLPTDPPGKSGFTNDTYGNPLTSIAWDQYSYLADAALLELFSPARRAALENYTGTIGDSGTITTKQAERAVRRFLTQAYRRTVSVTDFNQVVSRLQGLKDEELTNALKFEFKTALVSPGFLYRGFLVQGDRSVRQSVDDFELAERLSYFFWADMPDDQLFAKAASGTLSEPSAYAAEIDRLIASPKARSLAVDFAGQWFTLSEIDLASDNPPIREAWKSQPIDFMHYLFTESRPLIEMIDSDVAFINPHTSRYYGRDSKQIGKYVRSRGIEVEIVANQRIRLDQTTERGGLLTMPGILAMNRGPILRGTWILERILGNHLPEPPANVGQVAPNAKGEKLTFRERFELHRANEACAVCHDKIDPLGFALQAFDQQGQYLLAANYRPSGKAKKTNKLIDPAEIDTSGKLPSGQSFNNISELKKALVSGQREEVIRNIVQRTMEYALCRKLELFDRPALDTITDEMNTKEATWRDLFHAIAGSVPFRETILSERHQSLAEDSNE